MSSIRSVILGLFLLATVSILGYYTLFLTDFSLFKKQPELRVHFSQSNGLREGDAVLVAGMRWGRVSKMTFDPEAPNDRRVTVLVKLNDPLVLRDGFSITIRDQSLLGGRNLSIDPGPAEKAPIPADTFLKGSVAANPLDALSEMVTSTKTGVTEIVDNVRDFTADLKSGKGLLGRLARDEGMAQDIADAVSHGSKALSNFEQISSDLRAGRGTAGQLLVNDTLYADMAQAMRKLSSTLEEMNGLAGDVRRGNGVLGRLISDEALAADLTRAVAGLRSVVDKIDQGQGTAGHLINDDTIARNIEKVTTSLANGEGTLGALLKKAEVYENLRQITDDLANITGAIRSGQGSIGRLVMDDEIYQDLKAAVRIVQRSLEEFREAAPITTFTTVFFSAF